MTMRLAIIAGGGAIARQLFEHCQSAGYKFHIIALVGHADKEDVERFPHTWVRLGHGRKILDTLRSKAITDVVMIGNIRRPTLGGLLPDWTVIKLLPRLGWAMLGDDGLLRGIIKIFEEHGITVRGMKDLMPGLLAPAGIWTSRHPDDAVKQSISYGVTVAQKHGEADIGQAVVVRGDTTIATEDRNGTDDLLRRVRENGAGGILVKLCKPQQDKRADLPTIGVRTVENAAAAGLSGIVVSAGNTLVDNYAATVAAANDRGLFIMGIEA
ncbi:MAG: LpxI family protein [Bdellovibrionales bacterium]